MLLAGIPGQKTAAGGNSLGPALKTGTISDGEIRESSIARRGNLSPGFVWVSEGDYNLMRLCEIIVVVGICIMIIRVIVLMCRNYREKTYYYSKVTYDTDVSSGQDTDDL